MKDLGIFIITHKNYTIPDLLDSLKPTILYCGDNKPVHPQRGLRLISETDGINIHMMNPNINEMTAIYFIWKNLYMLENPSYICIQHYHRFFPLDVIFKYNHYDLICSRGINYGNDILTEFYRGMSLYNRQCIDEFLSTIKNNHKNEFKIIQNGFQDKILYPKNMFVMKRTIFENYCNFMFPIIMELSKLHKYGRILGFFCERLTSCYISYILKSNYKCIESEIIEFPY